MADGGSKPVQDLDLMVVARFDPKVRLYLFLKALGLLAVTGVGLVLLPFSAWVAWWWSGHFYDTLRCALTRRRLRFSYGIVFQRERTIPLDKIQDLSLIKGPLLTKLGLCTLRVETAGGGGSDGSGSVDLIGIVDAKAFQELVLAQRDKELAAAEAAQAPQPTPAATVTETEAVLRDIRDILGRIEQHLDSRSPLAPS